MATVNYDDPTVYETLWSDLIEVAKNLLGVDTVVPPEDKRVQYASYHWTGHEDLVHRSRHRSFDNLYIADAMAVVGTTSGWTSFNARVAGAVAARRALEDDVTCHGVRQLFSEYCCGGVDGDEYARTCASIRRDFRERSCCPADGGVS